ncbi:MAG TPA: hypothetical protein IAB27_04740 [Candidatus Coprosoma intestinipullorum]|uniref:Uncharacterized protein n=1 Tax=Candidatus Coprosoma intestinipullorum TaxID=2840752 RepID=A0A9D0ZSW8_9FIRM|nr:hypothetical protein [Candidatus Coprosoma intestinipullorum]
MFRRHQLKSNILKTNIVTFDFSFKPYAKYLEESDGDTDFDIASWKIIVNNQDISEATTMSSLMNQVYLDNENVAGGVIAPGSAGYFDLDIDASQTEASFSYYRLSTERQ